MSIEAQKLELISKIAALQDAYTLAELLAILENKQQSASFKREAGWGKGLFSNIADDFDDFIPPGFEDYLPAEQQLVKNKIQ